MCVLNAWDIGASFSAPPLWLRMKGAVQGWLIACWIGVFKSNGCGAALPCNPQFRAASYTVMTPPSAEHDFMCAAQLAISNAKPGMVHQGSGRNGSGKDKSPFSGIARMGSNVTTAIKDISRRTGCSARALCNAGHYGLGNVVAAIAPDCRSALIRSLHVFGCGSPFAPERAGVWAWAHIVVADETGGPYAPLHPVDPQQCSLHGHTWTPTNRWAMSHMLSHRLLSGTKPDESTSPSVETLIVPQRAILPHHPTPGKMCGTAAHH